MPVSKPWSDDEDRALIHYALHIWVVDGSWSNAPEYIPGRSATASSSHYRNVLQLWKPSERDRQAFAPIYERRKGEIWRWVAAEYELINPWANLGTLIDRQRLEKDFFHWYRLARKLMWKSIAVEMNLPPRVVETMFFMLEEKDRAVE